MRRPDLAAGLTDEQKHELGDLSAIGEAMARYVAPEPSAADTARLIGRLRPLTEQAVPEPLPLPPARVGWLRLVAAQVAVLEPGFLWATALLLGLGVTVAFGVKGSLLVPFLLASPVFAAAGVAYLFRPQARSLWELELASPAHPLELLYARLGLVSAANLALVLVLLAGLWLQEPRLVLWRLAVTWLGPMVGLSGLALYGSVRFGAVPGVILPMGLWACLVTFFSQIAARQSISLLERLDVALPAASESNTVLFVSAAALLLGVWLLRKGSRIAVGGILPWS